MALVQMRTPTGSYSMVDAALVEDYESQGWVETSQLDEFQGTDIVQYNEDGTVTLSDGTVTTLSNPSDGGEPPKAPTGFSYEQGLDEAKALYSFMDPEILEDYAKYWAKYGDSTIAIGMLRRESKAWEKQFGFLRRDDGTLIMSEKDAISNIYSYKSTLAEYDIEDTSMFEKKFEDLIKNGVAPIEFEERLSLVYNEVIDDIPEVSRLFAEQYNIEASNEAIFGALINKDIEDGLLDNQISTLKLQAEGTSRGFSTSFARAQSLRTRGIDRETARGLYEGAGAIISQAASVGRDLSIYELEEAAVGDQMFSDRVNRYLAEFASTQGVTTGAVKKGKQFTGLIEE